MENFVSGIVSNSRKLYGGVLHFFSATVCLFENMTSPIANVWVFGILTVCAVLRILFWAPEKRVPPPGHAIAALALLGVLISLHGESKAWQKVVYFLLAGSFLMIEIRAIKTEKRHIYIEQAAVRAEENARFTAIVDTLKRSLAESQAHFNATASRFETISSMITGGGGFCYMELNQSSLGRIEDRLLFVNRGEHPLYDVTATVIDLQPGETVGEHALDDSKEILEVGNIPAEGARWLPALKFSPQHASFSIIFTARNGVWVQQLRYKKVGEVRRKALKVSRWGSTDTLFELIDKDFPRDDAGNVNWY